jgi:osmotically-inducible protein OsmY
MDNRYRSKGYQQQDYRDPYARRTRQDEQLSTQSDDQYGEAGWRTQGDERWQSGADFDRGYGRNEPFGRSSSDGGYRSDTSALDDYDRATPASRYGRDAGRSYARSAENPRDRFETDRYSHRRDRSGYSDRGYGSSAYGTSSYDRIPPRQFDRDDRGFFDRASDELMSWFGDEDAARRRRLDHLEDHRGRGPANYARSSERLQEDACERLTRDHLIDASKITVTCSDNEITLDGTVDSRSAKRRAEDIVDDISGVKHVQNNLRVEARTSYYGETSTLTES